MTKRVDLTAESDWLPEGAAPPRMIVCEQTGRWAQALRSHWRGAGPPVHETRSLAACWEVLAQSPASFLVVEVTRSNAAALAKRMALFERHDRRARLVVVAERGLAGLEWAVREAGAVHFAVSLRNAGPVADMAVRHLARMPKPKRTFAQRVWDELPWRSGGSD